MMPSQGCFPAHPPLPGSFSVTVQVTDSAGLTATGVFSLNVVLPVISITTTSPLPADTVGIVSTARDSRPGAARNRIRGP